jgi:hypothetical protein
MKFAFVLVISSILLLSGCGGKTLRISNENIILAQEYCAEKGGLKEISTYWYTAPLFHCEDGTAIGTELLLIQMTEK